MIRYKALPVLVVLIASCSGSGSVSSTTVGGSETTPPAAADSASVSIEGFAFSPNAVDVVAGGEITWTNNDSTTHTVTFDDGTVDTRIGPGESITLTVDAGEHPYHCAIHSSMTGSAGAGS